MTLSRVERSDVANGSYYPVAVELSNLDGVDQATDRTAAAGATYYYRLVARRGGGEEVVFGPISAKLTAVVTAFALSRPAPNPVSAGPVRAVARESQVKITVLDVRGREVATVAEGRYTPGVYSVNWDRQANGGRASAGLYFIH